MKRQMEIQIIQNGKMIDTRTAASPARARQSLIAAVDRAVKVLPLPADNVELMVAEQRAAGWDGKTDIKIHVPTWNRSSGATIWGQS